MKIGKVDVSINYYGKPYQTLVTILTLWKHSAHHIDRIFLVIEKEQPYQQYGSIRILQNALKDLPVTYYFSSSFYYHGSPPLEFLQIPEKRYGLKYQFGLEKTDKPYHFLSHNDCLYQADLLGMMIRQVEEAPTEAEVAGIGMIGQCWNCPAFFSKQCDGSRFEQFKPTASELLQLVENYPPPRAAIHHRLIQDGYVHPLPECRLNEYACLVNAEKYKALTMPKGAILPLGASWHGSDWGAVWFYQMYHLGYKFIHFPFEPHMQHAPFSEAKSGHMSDHNRVEYFETESRARNFLTTNFPELRLSTLDVRVRAGLFQAQQQGRRLPGKLRSQVKVLLKKFR
ncbi:hypothetical protein [Arundinibacter roseus]|uniref:Uncharacterized protein n=1 Tax=Arundinibacter roseus TaxID=2070510 RepID=A0A4R4KLG9_9BACT|nr:hypothetical protein [Arundinibacter roseus]TDB69217.1 hypothetical protein EZE20_02465 [Arundinibacter roseus]